MESNASDSIAETEPAGRHDLVPYAGAHGLLLLGHPHLRSFRRPWAYRGVQMGWGLPLTAALLGIFHLLNLPELYAGHLALDWGAGVSTAAWGLFFGYLREWSGSVVAPAMVHGIPQEIAVMVMEW